MDTRESNSTSWSFPINTTRDIVIVCLFLAIVVTSVYLLLSNAFSIERTPLFYRLTFLVLLFGIAASFNLMRKRPNIYYAFWSDLSEAQYWVIVHIFMFTSQILFIRGIYGQTIPKSIRGIDFFLRPFFTVFMLSSLLVLIHQRVFTRKVENQRKETIQKLCDKASIRNSDLDIIHPILYEDGEKQLAASKVSASLIIILGIIVGAFLGTQASSIVDSIIKTN